MDQLKCFAWPLGMSLLNLKLNHKVPTYLPIKKQISKKGVGIPANACTFFF